MDMEIERPTSAGEAAPQMGWVSDALAELIRRLGIPYLSLTPGSSYRGLHDSVVNYLGNRDPQMIVCLHEEHAVAIAHGYAKVTDRPMAVALHSNVGLMHAAMALYNAFCDRVPMLVLGATGPVDAAMRRPWIDWIHTSADQGALVRHYTKWDDQPSSLVAALQSLVRADLTTRSHPPAPVYVCLDSALQESRLHEEPELPDLARHPLPALPTPGREVIEGVRKLLVEARRPLLLVGRVGLDEQAWQARVRLAERLGARVVTDLKVRAGFPTDHPLHTAVPGTFLTPSGRELLAAADVIVSLDWVDLGGTLRASRAGGRVVSCTLDHALHNGWSKDHFELAPSEIAISAHPDALVAELERQWQNDPPVAATTWSEFRPETPPGPSTDGEPGEITVHELAGGLRTALGDQPACLVRMPLGFDGADLHAEGPLDYLGQDGGAGVGSGPGMAVGAALALADGDRLAVAVLGDGDVLMGSSALWTAAHYRLGLLIVVANNGSFFNDEVHQQRVAMARDRPVSNRWIGQHIRDPQPDLAALAQSMGLIGHGPVRRVEELTTVLADGVAAARGGATVLVDVRVSSAGYPGAGG